MTSELRTSEELHKKALIAFQICSLLYITLCVAVLVKVGWTHPPPNSNVTISIIVILPLMLPVIGFFQKSLRAVSWLCFILCFYFISGVTDVWLRPEQCTGWIILISSSLLFINNILFIRWQGQHLRSRHNPETIT